jgi:hypothetical protein
MTAERRTKSPRDEKGPLTWLHQRRDKNGQPLISRQEREAGNVWRPIFMRRCSIHA